MLVEHGPEVTFEGEGETEPHLFEAGEAKVTDV